MSKKDTQTEAKLAEIQADDIGPAPKTRFAKIYDEAMANYKPTPPYPFGLDPDSLINISRPDTTERALALATIVDDRGNIDVEGLKPMLEALAGQAFDRVWYVVRDLPLEVTIALVLDMQDWFYGSAAEGVDDLPGGSGDSSS